MKLFICGEVMTKHITDPATRKLLDKRVQLAHSKLQADYMRAFKKVFTHAIANSAAEGDDYSVDLLKATQRNLVDIINANCRHSS
jgi:DNA replication initiation complex subunit (GINS family)